MITNRTKQWLKSVAVSVGISVFCALASPASANPQGISAPTVEADESMPGGIKTTYSCVCFGSYPMKEVTDEGALPVEDEGTLEREVIADGELYENLKNASWVDDETVLSGVRYRRLKADEASGAGLSRPQHYQWGDADTWHYFQYEPIRWRVLEVEDDSAMLVADQLLECAPFHSGKGDAWWQDCTLRSFLNGYGAEENSAGIAFNEKPQDSFYGTAFSEEEKQAILKETVESPDNYYFGTTCGEATEDRVFILSEPDVFYSGTAAGHGFSKGDGVDDACRQFTPTMYALARGAWLSNIDGFPGNGFWMLRTNGYNWSTVVYVCEVGNLFNRGIEASCPDAGILPAIRVDLSVAGLDLAGEVTPGQEKEAAPKAPAESALSLKEPVVTEDASMPSGLLTTWDCVYFGSYPMTEIVKDDFQALEPYAYRDTDVVQDSSLFERLESAQWTDNETAIDGERYTRMNAHDAVSWAKDSPQHYRWPDEESFHYFRYDPIKWRVIALSDEEALLLSDRELDCAPFNETDEAVSWDNSTLRSFLNGYDGSRNASGTDFSGRPGDSFYARAFSEEEKADIVLSHVKNTANDYYGTGSGADTEDYVTILNGPEVFASDEAARHGFYAGRGVDDAAKRFRPTVYAMARGTWYSPVEGYKGNGFWFMRTNGYTARSITYICDFGYIYNRGIGVTCSDSGLLPAIRVKTSSPFLTSAGTVTSADIMP